VQDEEIERALKHVRAPLLPTHVSPSDSGLPFLSTFDNAMGDYATPLSKVKGRSERRG
jgi:hypothetical protein